MRRQLKKPKPEKSKRIYVKISIRRFIFAVCFLHFFRDCVGVRIRDFSSEVHSHILGTLKALIFEYNKNLILSNESIKVELPL